MEALCVPSSSQLWLQYSLSFGPLSYAGDHIQLVHCLPCVPPLLFLTLFFSLIFLPVENYTYTAGDYIQLLYCSYVITRLCDHLLFIQLLLLLTPSHPSIAVPYPIAPLYKTGDHIQLVHRLPCQCPPGNTLFYQFPKLLSYSVCKDNFHPNIHKDNINPRSVRITISASFHCRRSHSAGSLPPLRSTGAVGLNPWSWPAPGSGTTPRTHCRKGTTRGQQQPEQQIPGQASRSWGEFIGLRV
jgi:hypothetical protein